MLDGDDVYWIEGRPREAGRNVIVRRTADRRTEDVNPPPLNARTRVHEYGGGAVTVDRGTVYYSGFKDQRLYRQERGAVPVPFTPEAPDPSDPEHGWRYADGSIDRFRGRWIGVREDHTVPHREAVNTIVDIDIRDGGFGRVLVEGNDFYSSPRLSPDGRRLAWLTWRHPNMPWVGNELWIAQLDADGLPAGHLKVAGGDAESLFQPEWSPDGILYFVSDRSGWWNLYRYDEAAGGQIVALCPQQAEFGQAQWNFGMSTYAFAGPSRICCASSEQGLGRLALLDLKSLTLTPLDLPYTDYSSIRAANDRVVFRGGSPTEPASIVLLDLVSSRTEVLRTSTPAAADPALRRYFTSAQPIRFPTESGQIANGLYYPPSSPDYSAPAGEKPPLVVTHKFESHYLDWLIGPYPAQQAVYRERSPIHHAAKLNAPVAFFQGDEDKIVPPDQTELMVEALRRRGIPVGYLLFAGEQHGFRQATHIKQALDSELYFYSVLVFRTGLTT